MFAIVVRFDLLDTAAAERFDHLVAEVVPGIRASEPGTLVYTPHTVQGEPLARVFYEVYRDREAHAAHEARPETAEFLREVRTLTASIRVELLEGALEAG
ncbi:putative quinol monooxygenase [Motilibacter deserti]|uniref:Antibiotic biosynthesis monooxygenase n=1 Tax=Motilibacter deserti TaxID=2714956 RepID=A0ABX0GZU4_9ACTN|nr:antibiotic biosynthesis monooxygenase [Motilibacter deserti]NHC16120.1 antibiotic biosynthesis monooxygenase [Motilibacter deserti]